MNENTFMKELSVLSRCSEKTVYSVVSAMNTLILMNIQSQYALGGEISKGKIRVSIPFLGDLIIILDEDNPEIIKKSFISPNNKIRKYTEEMSGKNFQKVIDSMSRLLVDHVQTEYSEFLENNFKK